MRIRDTEGFPEDLNTPRFRSAGAVICLYDTTNRKSFLRVQYFLDGAQPLPRDIVTLLVGNKTDIPERREVSRDEGRNLAIKYGIAFSEVSAQDTKSVEHLFIDLLMKMRDSQHGLFFKEPATVHQRGYKDRLLLGSPSSQPSISITYEELVEETKDHEMGGSCGREISWLWVWWREITFCVCGIRRP